MDIQNAQNMLIQEAVVDSCTEDNSGIVHQEKNTEICLLLNTGMNPAQLEEARGYNVLNKQSGLKQSVMLTENEDEGYEHPPSKKLKTEQNMQAKERVADCLILTQADKESENKIMEDESQQSDMDILLRTTNLLPEDKNKNDGKASSEETATSTGGYHNRTYYCSAVEEIKMNEAKEITGNKGITMSKIFTANSQEQTFMDQQLKQLSDQEIYHLGQETLIDTTKGPSCNHSDVEGPKKERIILQDQNNMPQNQEISLNEESCGKNNCFSSVKQTNESETEACSEGMNPAQLEEARGYNVLNKQSGLEQCVMLTENEDEGYEHPPSKKLNTEQNMQAKERVADCLILTQADKESENKIMEDESQQSYMDITLRTRNLLPGDKKKNDVKVSSEETATSTGGYHNIIYCCSAVEEITMNEAKEITGNKGVITSKIFTANSQEQTFMDQQLKQLSDQETYYLGQETLIDTTKGPSCNYSDVKGPKEERIILQGQNNMPQNQEISLNEESCGKNNCFSPAKETNESETGACSERNKIVSKEISAGNNVREIACLLNEDKSNLVQNEPNSKPETCEEFKSSDRISDDQQNHNHKGNNVTSSDKIIPPNVVDCEENGCVNAVENGDEVEDTTAQRNLHTIIFEDKTSWASKLQDEVFKLVDVPCDSATYTEIKSLFQNTTQKHFQLNKIVEVQNPFLYACYLLKKAEMKSRYGCIKEEYLFHGTKIKNIFSICEQNLDWRKHGSVTGNIFGRGASLTPISCYASHYSDKHEEEKIMFVFKVVIANETEGNPDMVIPPYKDTFKKLRYDTAIKPNRQVVVKFSDHEFYPQYLLYYTGSYRRYVFYDYSDDSD